MGQRDLEGLMRVTISTPQFKNGEITHYHTQTGYYDKRNGGFIPEKMGDGNHKIHFGSIENLEKFKVMYHLNS